MNWAHIHLLLNHVPVLGTIFGLALLAYAVFKRNDDLKRLALGMFVVVGLLALPVYFTGEPAEETVEHVVGDSKSFVKAHEAAALVSLIGVELLGLIALVGLYLSRGGRPLSAKITRATLVVSLVAAGLMARTANLGGQIRHAEIRAEAPFPAAEQGHDDGR
ncbi:MAG TPA: hypothetical protein VFU41_07185 [Gemmatimonadales bacterium]|nr:hypothetical protein [Gemmatimonadales bacterium]